MGGHPYWYFTKYTTDINEALQSLREREFRAGRYNPVMRFINFPLDANSPSPGPQHNSIAAALKHSGDDGTRSILDIETTGTGQGTRVAIPLDKDYLLSLYGTAKPSRETVENLDFLETVDRGQCVYLTIYKDDEPDELLFAGYSFD